MDLAIESFLPWRHFGIEGGIKAIKEAGFDAVDWSFFYEADVELCGDNYIENAMEIKACLQKYGLKCSQAHAPFVFNYDMPQDDSCFEYLSIKRSIEMAGIIGADHIVVHGIGVPDSCVSEQSMSYNYDFYKKLEPVAKKAGVKIAVENLYVAFTYPMLLNQILRRLDSEQFVGLVDVGHAWVHADMQPGNFIRQLDNGIIKGVHIHDNHGFVSGLDEHLPPFLGTIDFADLGMALKETGYSGDYTMELPSLRFYANKDLLIPALRFVEKVGRKLIADIENT